MINIDSILVVIEPEQFEQPALVRGIELAKLTDAKLVIMLCVYHASYELTHMLDDEERENFRAEYIADRYQWLEEALSDFILPAKAITAVHWHHNVFECISNIAKDEYTDIILKSRKKDPVVLSPQFTPLDWHLMRYSLVPVLLVNDTNTERYDKILTAVNTGIEDRMHSQLNEKVTECANDFAHLFASDLHLVNAYPAPPSPISNASQRFSHTYLESIIKNHHSQALNMFGDRYAINKGNRHIIEGEPHHVLPNLISSLAPQLLVVGNMGHAYIANSSSQQQSSFLFNHVNCDVLTVKPDGERLILH